MLAYEIAAIPTQRNSSNTNTMHDSEIFLYKINTKICAHTCGHAQLGNTKHTLLKDGTIIEVTKPIKI
jgi:hypothetical protein